MKKALTVIHIYYPEQTDLVLELLDNISIPYDLYCTIGNSDKYDYIKQKILEKQPNVNIITTANVGYDVWPFIHVINSVDLSKYDYIIKIHTKRDVNEEYLFKIGNKFLFKPGSQWRDDLYEFLKTKDNFNKCLSALENPNIGMCTRFNLIHNKPNHCGVIDVAMEKWPKYLLDINDYSFVAGTMFIAKAKPFQIIKDMNITEDLFEKPTQNRKTQFAHLMERMFGAIIYKSDMVIQDPFTSDKILNSINIRYKCFRILKDFVGYFVFFIPFPKVRRKLRNFLILHLCAWVIHI